MATKTDVKPWTRPGAKPYTLHNANVVDVATGTTHKSQTVRINNGKISSIAPSTPSMPAADPGVTTIDCTGVYLCPGLIDSHVHLIAVPGFNELSQAFGNPESVSLLRQPYVCAQMLHRGFTSVRDTGGADWGLKEATDKWLLPGPRLFIAGKALGPTGGHSDGRRRTDHGTRCHCCDALHFAMGLADGVAECLGDLGGLPVRQREEHHVVTGEDLDRGRLEHPVGERHQVWLERPEQLAGVGAGREGADLDPGVAEQEPQDLAPGVPAGARDRGA